ncbi:hypothetical protein RGCCGE502_21400 [Rhizobium grahamii CCGE 502]|uniref:Uncharacterized protein n=1 Tax=Rhizobium grahamii CCGE 502 TaxID=990285 RepID=S3HC52_9HYPH|nr:hypothetical protein RGCCGE502_21400 [Rhizobium grahamii CCGE 502]
MIQLQAYELKKDQWLWAGHCPNVAQRHLLHQGYEAEGRESIRKIEDYYDRLLAYSGLRGRE